MNQDEVESQLSAMFDGELPAAECELLSRRIQRDESLRARWSRYALIGAAMRSEPVATAPPGFAQRVSAALDSPLAGAPRRLRRRRKLALDAALAATLVAAVAGLSVSMLREVALNTAGRGPLLQAASSPPDQRDAAVALETAAAGGASLAAAPMSPAAGSPADGNFASALKTANGGAFSYVTPAGNSNAATMLRTQLADYIVAHSAYSTPLLRRNVLSELVTSDDQMGIASYAGVGTRAGGDDAVRPTSDSSR